MFSEILNKNLDIIFLVYGLSFFSMGIAIFIKRPSQKSSFKLAAVLWLLAAFGIIHGINEWLDMFSIIKRADSKGWLTATTLILTLSYIYLFEFGRQLVNLHAKWRLNKIILIILSVCAIVPIFILKQPQSIWPRYLLGFPAGLLSTFGLIRYYTNNRNTLKLLKIRRYFFIAAWVLGIYSIFGGLIVPKSNIFLSSIINYESFLKNFGVPVQMLRGLCAVILSLAIYKILDIFYWEETIELKSALQEVTAAKAYVENILKSIIDTLIIVDSNAKIRAVNKSGCEILGYDENELLGKSITKLFKKRVSLKGKTLREFIVSGFLKNYAVNCFTKDKSSIPMIFSGSVMRDINGKINAIVGVGKDMRELEQLQKKLLEAERFAAMGKVSSIIGHELKNQLGIMRNAVYYIKLKLQNKDEKIDKHLNMLDNEIVEIDHTMENILTFAKTKQLKIKIIDLKNVLSSVIEKISVPNGITVTTSIADNLPKLAIDDIQISRVFVNLILNAIDAIGNEGNLDINVKEIGDYIVINFTDTGCGIKNEDKKKIFEPFFSNKAKGTGLGLATSKIIIEAHKGSIDIKSEINKGTSVIIKLPIINQNGKADSQPKPEKRIKNE